MASRAGIAVIAGLVALGAALILLSDRSQAPYVDAGVQAPGFALPRLEGGAPLALESLRGRIVLVNFWATWCKPCEGEMPSMERLHRSLAGERFALLAVSVDEAQPPVVEFRDRHGLSFPILLDAERRAANAYQTHRFPESFLIDARGRVVQRYIGPRDWDAPEYRSRIRELLAVLP